MIFTFDCTSRLVSLHIIYLLPEIKVLLFVRLFFNKIKVIINLIKIKLKVSFYFFEMFFNKIEVIIHL